MRTSWWELAPFNVSHCRECRVVLAWFSDTGPALADATCPCCGEKLEDATAADRESPDVVFDTPTTCGAAGRHVQAYCAVHCTPRQEGRK